MYVLDHIVASEGKMSVPYMKSLGWKELFGVEPTAVAIEECKQVFEWETSVQMAFGPVKNFAFQKSGVVLA